MNSHITYCIETWSSADYTDMKPLIVMQYKVVKMMHKGNCNVGINCNSNIVHEMCNHCDILKLHDAYFTKISTLVYEEFTNINCVVKFGFKRTMTHHHETRCGSNQLLPLISHKTNFFKRRIVHARIHFYNSIPDYIKNSLSLYKFKFRLKNWISITNLDIYQILHPYKYL